MTWDVWVVAATNPPPILAQIPDDGPDRLLGSRFDVRQRISHCFGDVDWADPTLGEFQDADVSLEFDLGDDEPCTGFMIRVKGAGAVEHLLVRLIEQSGWHMYDCADGQLLQLDGDTDEDYSGRRLPRELPAAVWKHVLRSNAGVPLVTVAIAWSFYVSAVVFHFDLVSFLSRRDPQPVHELISFAFWIAVAMSVVGAAYGIFDIRRALWLARYGTAATARVTGLGTVGYYGQIRVYYEFSFKGQAVRTVMSCLREEAQKYQDGVKPLVVICDPARPCRSMLKSDVLPDTTSDAESLLA